MFSAEKKEVEGAGAPGAQRRERSPGAGPGAAIAGARGGRRGGGGARGPGPPGHAPRGMEFAAESGPDWGGAAPDLLAAIASALPPEDLPAFKATCRRAPPPPPPRLLWNPPDALAPPAGRRGAPGKCGDACSSAPGELWPPAGGRAGRPVSEGRGERVARVRGRGGGPRGEVDRAGRGEDAGKRPGNSGTG